MRIAWWVLFVLAGLSAKAQQDYFNTDVFWQRLVPENSSVAIKYAATDTVIVVASNRRLVNDCLRFATNCVDDSAIHYFVVYSSLGKWHVHAEPDLKTAITHLPQHRDWVIYIEGMGKVFTGGLDRGMQMAAQYGVNVLYLDYPSSYPEANPLRNFIWVNHNAKHTWKYFTPVLEDFRSLQASSGSGISHTLLLHSMGNHYIRQVVKHKALLHLNESVWVDNLVLNAPCIPRSNSCRILNKVKFARHIYINYNNEDGVLKWAKLATHRQLLGNRPTRTCAAATYVNFNAACGVGHSNFLSLYAHPVLKKEAKLYYSYLLHGKQVNLSDTAMFRISLCRGIGYDLLPAKDSAASGSVSVQ